MNSADRVIMFKFMTLCLWGINRILTSLVWENGKWERDTNDFIKEIDKWATIK